MNPHKRFRILIGLSVFLILLGVVMLLWRIFLYQRSPGLLNYVDPALAILMGVLGLVAAYSRRK